MGGELFFYTLFLPMIGSFITLYSLWKSHIDVKTNPDFSNKIEQPVPSPDFSTKGKIIGWIFLLIVLISFIPFSLIIIAWLAWHYSPRLIIKDKDTSKTRFSNKLKAASSIFITLAVLLFYFGQSSFFLTLGKFNTSIIPLEVSNRILLAVGFALGVSSVAAGIVMAVTFKEAIRGIIQRPGIAIWMVILSTPALGIAFFGLIISFMIIGQWGDLGFADTSSLFAAGIAIGVACIGAAIAMSVTNKEAVKGMVERPAIATWYIIIAALSEGLVLYGMVIAFMIIGKIGGLSLAGSSILTASGITIGLAAIGAGIGIAITIKENNKSMIRKPRVAPWIVIMAALSVGVALYGLVIAFMMIGKVYGDVNPASANMLYNSAWKFGGLLILSGLLVGYLPTKIADGSDTKTWIKKIILAAIGESLALVALVWMFMAIGRV